MAAYLRHFFGVGIPAVLIFACSYPHRCRALAARRLTSSPLREAGLSLFVLCLFGLAGMVLWPGHSFEAAGRRWGENMNLVPLRMVAEYIRAFRDGELFYAIVMLFGNIGTFLPLGFFPVLLYRGFGAKKALLFGLAFSLGAECCQFFLGRHCDVDDVILNVLGVMLGCWLCLLFRCLFPWFSRRFQCQTI